jgi:hypothetical protein
MEQRPDRENAVRSREKLRGNGCGMVAEDGIEPPTRELSSVQKAKYKQSLTAMTWVEMALRQTRRRLIVPHV